MDESHDEVILDEVATPDGALELVAYQSSGTVHIGVRPKGSNTQGAIALHTRSVQHYVEATAWIHRTWGVAYGAVAPEIERVAVRNERGELFPARIIPLPPILEEEYRAAWGIATCQRESELIGYDDRGRLIDQIMIRPREQLALSTEASLELIRAHCDNGLRYYTWALKRMPSIPEQAGHVGQVRNLQHALAQVLAYVEGATDEQIASSATPAIVRRYAEAVEAEGWEPPFARQA